MVGTKAVVGHSLWKASEVDYDHRLPTRIAKHDILDAAKVTVGDSNVLRVLVYICVLPRGLLREVLLHDARSPTAGGHWWHGSGSECDEFISK